MSVFHIKLLAIITMFIDHIGLFFFPEHLFLRAIGRLSFPLFAWLIANGAYHTKSINNYIVRLFILAVISQIPYMAVTLFIDPQSTALNIFFTLSIGLVAIALIKKTSKRLYWVIISIATALFATWIHTDYGGFGVLSIVAFYLYFKNPRALILSQVWIYCLMSAYFLYQGNSLGYIQLFGLVAITCIHFYSGKEGVKMKYFFYLIYPVHYVIIYLLLQARLF